MVQVEYAERPLAVGTRQPRFSWVVPDGGRGTRQTAYQIQVATARALLVQDAPDMWDSGKVDASQSMQVPYAGKPLASNMDCYWRVRLWHQRGEDLGYGEIAAFGTALFDPGDWQAEWIGMGDPAEPIADPDTFQQGRIAPEVAEVEPDDRAPMLRKAFAISRPVKRARIFVCGLGFYELHLNGSKVGDAVLATPRTEFRKTVLYSTYDVTASLQQGPNVLGLWLGNGWFNGHKRFWGWQQQWYGSPRGIVQLVVAFEDGGTETIVSDASWKGAWSPITNNCIYDGEVYDARLEQPGWDKPGFDDSAWRPANGVPAPGGTLRPMCHEEGHVVERFRPVAMCEPEPGVFVYDMGKNMTGWVRCTVRGGSAGDTITLRFGEARHENGTLDNRSSNAALQRDQYTCKGAEVEWYEPRFTYHGFQYVEVTGYPGQPTLDTLEGCFVRTAVAETGTFSCGNALLNKIHACTVQSQKCNIQMGVPTDDTQRPERLGWAGDVWSFAEECFYNLWSPRVYAKWIADFYDQQDETGMVGMIVPQAGAEEDLVWSAAFVLIPWWLYLHYGDIRILEESYPYLKRYLAYLERVGVRSIEAMPTEELLQRLRHGCPREERYASESERGYLQLAQWGDHLATNEGASGFRKNQPLSIATAFYYADVMTMVKIAGVLGRYDDAATYRVLGAKIRDAFHIRFYDSGSGFYDIGCQSAQAWALAFGLVPEADRTKLEMYLNSSVNHRQQRLTTGYAGTKWAVKAIADSGRNDIVWNRAIATEYPSWGYMLKDPKRTTITENWMGKGGSLCHTTLGAAIDEWFYWGLAGIRPDVAGPGYEKMVIQPYMPPDLPWARATLQTQRGKIVAAWQHDGKRATLTVSIPANCTATVHIPASQGYITEGTQPVVEAEGVQACTDQAERTRVVIGSGKYAFTFPYKSDG